jgi:hypothetical protein
LVEIEKRNLEKQLCTRPWVWAPASQTTTWCHTSVTPAFGRLRQEDCEFEASLDYTVKPCLKNKNNNKKGFLYLLFFFFRFNILFFPLRFLDEDFWHTYVVQRLEDLPFVMNNVFICSAVCAKICFLSEAHSKAVI